MPLLHDQSPENRRSRLLVEGFFGETHDVLETWVFKKAPIFPTPIEGFKLKDGGSIDFESGNDTASIQYFNNSYHFYTTPPSNSTRGPSGDQTQVMAFGDTYKGGQLLVGPHNLASTTGSYDPAYYGNLSVHEFLTIMDQTNNLRLLGFFVDTVTARHRILSTRYGTVATLYPISIEIGDQGVNPSFYMEGSGANLGNIGFYTNNPTFELTLNRDRAGATVSAAVSNRNNSNLASDSRVYVSVGLNNTSGAGAGDPYIFFNVFNVTGWTLGIDNSDSDKLKFDYTTGSTNNPGTNTVMTMSSSKFVGIGSTAPETYLHIQGDHVSNRGLAYFSANSGQASYLGLNAESTKDVGILFNTANSPIWIIERTAGTIDLHFRYIPSSAHRAVLSSTGNWTIDGNLVTKSDTSFSGTFDHAITADRTWTFQNVTGTVYSTSGQDVSIADGGTNSSAALSNGRLMISSGGAIVERAALTASALVVGDTTNGVASLALGAANRVVGMNSGATAIEYKDVLGTSNQITVTHAANSITLSTPQNIHTGATPTFSALTTTNAINIGGDLNHDGSNIGLFGATPVARPAAYTQTYATTSRTHSARTGDTITDNSGGTASTTVADTPAAYDETYFANTLASIIKELNDLKADADNSAQVLNQLIDDLQSRGDLQ